MFVQKYNFFNYPIPLPRRGEEPLLTPPEPLLAPLDNFCCNYMLFLSQTVIIWHFWLWIIWSVCQCTIDRLKIKVKSSQLWQIISHSILTKKLPSFANTSCNSSKVKRINFTANISKGGKIQKTVAHVCSKVRIGRLPSGLPPGGQFWGGQSWVH